MQTRHTRGKTTWVDLENPTDEEVSAVMAEFGIDERVREEIATPTPYPLSVSFPGYTYLILHFPVSGSADGTRAQEIDFIVGKDFLLTVRYESIETLHTFHKLLEAEELLATRPLLPLGNLLESVFARLYAAIGADIELASKRLERIERDIFSGKERQTVRSISEIGRVLLRFETALERHEDPLADFLAVLATPTYLGTRFDAHAARIEAQRVHAAKLVSSHRAVLRELRLTNDSLLSASQNEITKTLTVLAFTAVPLTLIASVFGMNVQEMPIVNTEHAFATILFLMAGVAAALFLFFKGKRWL